MSKADLAMANKRLHTTLRVRASASAARLLSLRHSTADANGECKPYSRRKAHNIICWFGWADCTH